MTQKLNLSNFELEVMRYLWDAGEAIVPDIHKQIQETRPISYSAVKTIFDRLEEKGAIRRVRTYGRTILYAPNLTKRDLEGPLFKDFVTKMFGGKIRPLMSHIVAKEDLSLEDIGYLESLLARRRKEMEDEP